MRIEILKEVKERYIPILDDILNYEERYGKLNRCARKSSNGICWKREQLDINLSPSELRYLIRKGIIEAVDRGGYHISPEIRNKLKEELKFVERENREKINFENSLDYSIRKSEDARAILSLLRFQKRWSVKYGDIGWKISKAKGIVINEGSDISLLTRLKDSGIMREIGEDEYEIVIFDESLLDKYLQSSFSTQDAVWESLNVVIPMKRRFENFISSLGKDDIDEIVNSIRDLGDILDYTRHIMGELYMDALLPIIQQYGMVDIPIYSSSGKKITQTGFSLAYFGEPGTGKTFATDDFLRGNEKNGIPPHGIIGRLRYAEGMTPKKFISILEAYVNYPVDWIIPEFNDFFRYRGMVEKLKLIMEQREVGDETKNEVIKPYKVTSFFIVNYNTHTRENGWKVTIEDPNFNAIEDRMLCKIFINNERRERAIYENMVRRISGDIEWYLSEELRKHLTYSYYYLKNNPPRVILDTSDFVVFGNRVREMRGKKGVKISNRIIMKGIQIAGSASLIKALHTNSDEIKIGMSGMEIALKFIEDEIKTRSMKI